MTLTTERIRELERNHVYNQTATLIDFARAIEAEVRKDDDALILQLVEALECHCEMTRSLVRSELAITAGRARLAPPPPTA